MTSNYDVKWYRCYWNIDPAIQTIPVTSELETLYHFTIKKVGDDVEGLHFNTAISQMMIFVNEVMKAEKRPRQLLEPFILLLSPFAPHIAEELWEKLGHATSLAYEPWPSYDATKLRQEITEIVFQVNGKVRGKLTAPVDLAEKDLEAMALADDGVKRHIDGKQVVKAIVVKNKLVNIVVR